LVQQFFGNLEHASGVGQQSTRLIFNHHACCHHGFTGNGIQYFDTVNPLHLSKNQTAASLEKDYKEYFFHRSADLQLRQGKSVHKCKGVFKIFLV